MNLEGERYQNEIFRLSRVLRGISEKKVDPGKCPKPTLPHSSSILDIADLEFDISVQTIAQHPTRPFVFLLNSVIEKIPNNESSSVGLRSTVVL